MVHTTLGSLTVGEIRRLTLPILHKYFAAFEFQDVAVWEEEDFDGASVIRMTANVNGDVPARALIKATAAIMTELSKQGDDRFVYLSTRRPGEVDLDEDVEE